MDVLNKIYNIIMTKQILGSVITLVIAVFLVSMINGIISKILITGK